MASRRAFEPKANRKHDTNDQKDSDRPISQGPVRKRQQDLSREWNGSTEIPKDRGEPRNDEEHQN